MLAGRFLFVAAAAIVMGISLSDAGGQTAQAPNGVRCGRPSVVTTDQVLSLASDNERIIISKSNEAIAFDPSLSTLQWLTNIPKSSATTQLITRDRVILILQNDTGSAVYSLDPLTGLIRDRIELPNLTDPEFVLSESMVVAFRGNSAIVAELGSDISPRITRLVFDAAIRKTLISRSGIIFFVTDSSINLIDSKSGFAKSSFPGEFRSVTSLLESSGNLLVGESDGSLSFHRSGDLKKRWTFRAGGRISGLGLIENDILVSSHDNFLYRIGLTNGTVEWKKRIGGRILFSPTVTSKVILVTDSSSGHAEALEPRTGRSMFKLRLGEDIYPKSAGLVTGQFFLVPTSAGLFSFDLSDCK